MDHTRWPAPLLQPDPHDGCVLYSVAYLCRCLGHPDVTPEQVQQFRQERRLQEYCYPGEFGDVTIHYWQYRHGELEWQRFWLGPAQRSWVESYLAAGYLGLASVKRTPGYGHALVVLEDKGDDGVLVMDPLYGHRIESWDWLLASGVGHLCHRINGWYRAADRAVARQ